MTFEVCEEEGACIRVRWFLFFLFFVARVSVRFALIGSWMLDSLVYPAKEMDVASLQTPAIINARYGKE